MRGIQRRLGVDNIYVEFFRVSPTTHGRRVFLPMSAARTPPALISLAFLCPSLCPSSLSLHLAHSVYFSVYRTPLLRGRSVMDVFTFYSGSTRPVLLESRYRAIEVRQCFAISFNESDHVLSTRPFFDRRSLTYNIKLDVLLIHIISRMLYMLIPPN